MAAPRDANRIPAIGGQDVLTGGFVSPTITTLGSNKALDVNVIPASPPAFSVSIQVIAIAASTAGDNTIISAQSGKQIYVFAWSLSYNGAVNVKFTDGAGGTNFAGLFYGVANAGGGNSVTPPYYLWTGSASTALVLNLSANVAVGGSVSYFVF